MDPNQTKREATKAGSWYEADGKILQKQIDSWLSGAKKSIENAKSVKAIIGPHAGYRYSGPTAAWAYNYIPTEETTKVFLLGPCHHTYIKGCGLTSLKTYETPLGNIDIDTETIQTLAKENNFEFTTKDDEEEEHSLEMHLPFIKRVFGEKQFKLIPIMVGQLDSTLAEYYGKVLSKYFDQSNTLFVISSDFCHWGKRFSFTYYNKSDGEIYKSVEKLDGKGMKFIENHDASGFSKYIMESKNTICGRNPITILLNVIQNSSLKELKTQFVQYAQSSQVKSESDSSVSYAASITFLPV